MDLTKKIYEVIVKNKNFPNTLVSVLQQPNFLENLIRYGNKESLEVLTTSLRVKLLSQPLEYGSTSRFLQDLFKHERPAAISLKSARISDTLSICYAQESIVLKSQKAKKLAMDHYLNVFNRKRKPSFTALSMLMFKELDDLNYSTFFKLWHDYKCSELDAAVFSDAFYRRTVVWQKVLEEMIKGEALHTSVIEGFLKDFYEVGERILMMSLTNSNSEIIQLCLNSNERKSLLPHLLKIVHVEEDYGDNLGAFLGYVLKTLIPKLSLEEFKKIFGNLLKIIPDEKTSQEISEYAFSSFLNATLKSDISPNQKLLNCSMALRDLLNYIPKLNFVFMTVLVDLFGRSERYDVVLYLWHEMSKSKPYGFSKEDYDNAKIEFPLQLEKDEYSWMIPILQDSILNQKSKKGLSYSPLLSIVIDNLGFWSKKRLLYILYEKIQVPSEEFPTLQLNHFNSFIEAFCRCRDFNKAWDVLWEAEYYGRKYGLWSDLEEKTIGSFFRSRAHFRDNKKQINDWTSKALKRYPQFKDVIKVL